MVARVLVVGSVNVDLHLRVERLPAAGETVLASELSRLPGGKGANQAAALAGLGVDVQFLGAVGRDAEGALSRAALESAGVGTRWLRDTDAPTGLAVVSVDDAGDNVITVLIGANAEVLDEDLIGAAFDDVDAVLLQLELPMGTVAAAARAGRAAGATVVLNAAPAQPLDATLLGDIDLLVVNRGEAAVLAGSTSVDEIGSLAAAVRGALVVTLGGEGCLVVDAAGARPVPAYPAAVVDSTGAGDCFVAALVAELVGGAALDRAADFANAAAALSVTRPGARSAPSRGEIAAAWPRRGR